MPGQSTGGNRLSTARINRFLRHLHQKCASLVSYSKSSTCSSTLVTYVSRSTKTGQGQPPLSVLKTPRGIGARVLLDKTTAELAEAAKNVYAVTDCFHSIVRSAFGSVPSTTAGNGTLSLASMCAVKIGESLCIYEGEERVDDDDDDEDQLAQTNLIYDSIPQHQRPHTLVSHALSVILDTCPHSPTLLSTLLSIAVQYIPHMVRESELILHTLLVLAFTPSPFSPPVVHPAHASFLTSLRRTWTTCGHKYCTDMSFARILVDSLHAVDSAEAWTCKALSKVAAEFRASDPSAFAHLLIGICEALIALPRGKTSGNASEPGAERICALRSRLCHWIEQLFNDIFERGSQLAEVCAASAEFLLFAHHSGLPASFPAKSLDPKAYKQNNVDLEVNASLTCLATHLLICPRNVWAAQEQHNVVETLRTIVPRARTFASLVSRIFSLTTTDHMQCLSRYAALLRDNSLLQLEASLWSCALTHLDMELGAGHVQGTGPTKKEQDEMRMELIELVDDAEWRCFGPGSLSRNCSAEGCSEPKPSQECEWEEVAGSWVRKSPVAPRPVKRSKTMVGHNRSPVRTRRAARVLLSVSQHALGFPKLKAALPPKGAGLSQKPYLRQLDRAKADQENEPPLSSSPIRLPPRWNFTSLISDALKNRQSLHPGQRRATLAFPCAAVAETVHEPEVVDLTFGDNEDCVILPSSDDLDLFAIDDI